MKTTPFVLTLIVAAALWRIATVYHPALFNVAPITALAFCAAVYIRDWRWWLVPFAALMISDVWLNQYHALELGYTWSIGEMALRVVCFGGVVGLGSLVARRRNAATIAMGAIGSSIIFYLGTNSVAWLTDPFYAKTVAGWVQAMTVGHPEFPPTLWFLRNTILGDVLFTALFAAAFEFATRRQFASERQNATR